MVPRVGHLRRLGNVAEANPKSLIAQLWCWHTGWRSGWKTYHAHLAKKAKPYPSVLGKPLFRRKEKI
jgi:hypothetical protein